MRKKLKQKIKRGMTVRKLKRAKMVSAKESNLSPNYNINTDRSLSHLGKMKRICTSIAKGEVELVLMRKNFTIKSIVTRNLVGGCGNPSITICAAN